MDNELNNVIYECKNCEFEKKQNKNKIDISYILPFKITKDDAKKILINSYKKKYFLPELYKNKNMIDKIIGLYIPVGLYDTEINFSLNMKGTKKDNKFIKDYNIDRVGISTYNNIIINNNIVNNFDDVFSYSYKDIREYDESYLSGYITDISKLEYNDLVDFDCDDFKEGLARVKQDNKWGFVDKSGRLVVPCIYDFCDDFEDGLARVKQSDKWGFIDKTGKEEIPCKFELCHEFREGFANIKLNEKWGFVDKTGRITILCKYDLADYHNWMYGNFM